ncbi:ABC transporter permease [Antrihabitans spumae]|uniref:ABC transporter permease n=1 Tax=Antrihabitans spumae TaxID=3373370 RepID=A0ABW7K996_9NOCA
MTTTLEERKQPSVLRQWWVLTLRQVAPSLRNGEIATAILTPVVFTVGFYIPLNLVMSTFGHGLSSYAQFLMPMIVLQALAFAAITAALRAATDTVDGINRRFGSMPIGVGVPLAARMSANMFRCVISVSAAVVCGYVIGFRFALSAIHTVGFLLFALLVGAALSLGADVLGSLSKSPEATTQSLTLPQLILGMLSAGFAPASQFPGWIQGFVRNQPVSQFAYALRALAGDSTGGAGVVNWSTMGPPLAWVIGLIVVFAPLSIIITSRRP